MKACKNCSRQFTITDRDRQFLKKIAPVINGQIYEIPEPTYCPACRIKRRLAFRNERKLFKRKCDLCQKTCISIYSNEYKGPVYCQSCWWSDDWNALDYAQEFDFDRPFFEQFHELLLKVPKVCLYNIMAENAEYCNFCMGNKDCYLVFGSDKNRDCYYSTWIYECTSCIDCSYCYNSELLYNCLDCLKCYNCTSCQDCEICTDCEHCIDCIGCKNCYGCVGLRHKEFHIYNEPVSPEAYQAFMNKKLRDNKKFEELKKSVPRKAMHVKNSEDIIGDYIVNSKNIRYCFDVRNGRDIAYSHDIFDQAKDCMDCSFSGEIENCYEGYEVHGHSLLFSNRCWPSSHSIYLDNCDNCSDCFGCAGLRRKQYCILNTQYSKEEYEKLVPKIIEHMNKTREWGEFFPVKLSPFINQPEPEQPKAADASTCEKCQKAFRVIPQEKRIYTKFNVEAPTNCPDCRTALRHTKRNPRCVQKCTCQKCNKGIYTTFDTTSQIIYCELCFLEGR